jgi:hypothetical protein
MPPEVTITWAEPRKSSPYTLARSSIKDDDGEMPLEPGSLSNSDKSDRSSSEPLSMPTLLQRLMWRHSVLFNTAQELTLLLLIGMGTTAVVYSVDKSIDVMLKWRMNTRLSWHVAGGFLPEYLVWIGSSMLLCTLSAACVHLIGPCAAGSGIPLMKCVLSGAQMDDYISFRTLVAKATSLAFAYSGGLSVGKEGPFVHMASPIYLQHKSRRGPTFRETLLMHAIARIAYHGLIDNIQVSWTKIGKAGAAQLLQSGCNDLGGTLMNENISRAAGASHGQEMTEDSFREIVEPLGRILQQRSTLYGKDAVFVAH